MYACKCSDSWNNVRVYSADSSDRRYNPPPVMHVAVALNTLPCTSVVVPLAKVWYMVTQQPAPAPTRGRDRE
jgi:hypothetical protein